MRIAIDAHMVGTRETGNEAYVTGLVRGFQRNQPAGVEFGILQTADSKSPLDPSLPSDAFRLMRMNPATALVRIPWSMPRLARREGIDVLHVTYNAPPWLPSCALVVSVHDLAYKLYPQYYSPRVRLLLSSLVPLSMRRAERVLVLAENTKADIIRQYGVPAEKIVVTLAAAGPEYRVLEDQKLVEDARARYGLQGPFVLAVGNLEPRKNLLRLLRAYAALLDGSDVPAKLAIVGKAHWQGSAVGREMQKLDLSERVVFTGYVPTPDLVALYNAATVFVYPSLYEGFGLPVLEAMSCGTPVITSDVSSIPEVAGPAAVLVDPYSERDLAEALGRLLADETLQDGMREAGLRQAAQFSWEKTAQITMQAYEQALEDRSSSRMRRQRIGTLSSESDF